MLHCSSRAAEAVLATGLGLKTAELPPGLQADLMLIREGCVGRWGLLGYTETMDPGLGHKVPQLWQWEVMAKGSISLLVLDICRPSSAQPPSSWRAPAPAAVCPTPAKLTTGGTGCPWPNIELKEDFQL